MDTFRNLPFVARVDDTQSPGDVVDMLALGRFVAGAHPWARSLHLQRVRPGATLLPPGVTPSRSVSDRGTTTQLAGGAGWDHLGPLPPDEAAAWLGRSDGIDGRGMTLAELLVRRGDLHKVDRPEPGLPIGQYL